MEPFQIEIISAETAGDLQENQVFMKNLSGSGLAFKLLDSAREGTPLIRIGKGSPKIMLTAGVHGNELSPQIAALDVAQKLVDQNIEGTV